MYAHITVSVRINPRIENCFSLNSGMQFHNCNNKNHRYIPQEHGVCVETSNDALAKHRESIQDRARKEWKLRDG